MSCYDVFANTQDRSTTEIEAAASKNTTLSRLLVLHAIDSRSGSSLAREAHRDAFHPSRMRRDLSARLKTELKQAVETLHALGLEDLPLNAIQRLPLGSVLLVFDFTLEKKFVSRDDNVFYPIDNPIRKERVLKIPMTSGSSWKGSLRAAAVESLVAAAIASGETNSAQLQSHRRTLIDIFGDEKGEDAPAFADRDASLAAYLNRFVPMSHERTRKARLRCLPTYYETVDLDILNPRDRKTRAGTVPIVMEVVPAGARGRFGVLYLPFDLLGNEMDLIQSEVSRDWKFVGDAMHRMFRASGFGAKKSSGCGKAKAGIANFRFECRLPGFQTPRVNAFEDLKILHRAFGTAQ